MLSRFIDKLREQGLEMLGLFYGVYTGEVVEIDDPEGLGRIRVKVPSVHNDGDEALPWAYPASQGFVNCGAGYGTKSLPNVGDMVWVVFRFGRPQHPIYLNGWWSSDQMPEELSQDHVQGFKTEAGHLAVWRDGDDPSVEFKHSSGARLEFLSDGSITITTDQGEQVELKPGDRIAVSAGRSSIKVDRSGIEAFLGSSSVKVTSSQVMVKSGTSVTVSSPLVTLDGKAGVSLGGASATSPVVKGDILLTYLFTLYAWLTAHVHGPPGSPPVAPPPPPPFNLVSLFVKTK